MAQRVAAISRQLLLTSSPVAAADFTPLGRPPVEVEFGLRWPQPGAPGDLLPGSLQGLRIRQDVNPEELAPDTTFHFFPRTIDPESSFSHRTGLVTDIFTEDEISRLIDVSRGRSWGRFAGAENQTTFAGLGTGLPTRYDSQHTMSMQLRHVGIQDAPLGASELGARTNYFRETFWYPEYGEKEDVDFVMHNPKLLEAARVVFPDRPIIEPYICYGNLIFRGMFIGVHTDCPAFRGMTRATSPQWLLSVMHHSGLFDAYRVPIVNAIIYLQDHATGGLRHFPEGNAGKPSVAQCVKNTAFMCDPDSCFHGVEFFEGTPPPRHNEATRLVPITIPGKESENLWTLEDNDGNPVGDNIQISWEDIRYSVLVKYYCFKDEAERQVWENHTDDITMPQVLDTLISDLRKRGRLPEDAAPPKDQVALAKILIAEYYHDYPGPEHNIHLEVAQKIQFQSAQV